MLSSRPEGATFFAVAGNVIGAFDVNHSITFLKDSLDENRETPNIGGRTSILCCSLSNSSRIFAVCDIDKKLRIFESDGHSWRLSNEQTFSKKISCITFMPNDEVLLLGQKSGYVIYVSVSGGKSDLSKEDEEDGFLGHISLLTSVVSSKDGRLIATCDRDEKLRVSYFRQPYNIESFCLGHTKPISEIAFVDNRHLVSVGGDEFIRIWDAFGGYELDAINLTPCLNDLRKQDVDGASETFLISRLIVVGRVVVLGVRSHDCIVAVKLSENFSAFEKGSNKDLLISGVLCPTNERFLDCCVINHRIDEQQFEVVCMTEPLSRLVSWFVSYSQALSVEWSLPKEWDILPPELKSQNGNFPRLEMLMEMGKSFINMGGINAYEESKETTHKRIKERHQRHQAKRKRLKAGQEERLCVEAESRDQQQFHT